MSAFSLLLPETNAELAAAIVWLVSMILVPIIAAAPGSSGKVVGISMGVVAQVCLVVVVLARAWGVSAVSVAVLVPALGWFAEFVGSRTGIPFGQYTYTPILVPQVHKVPIAVPMAWLMMMPPSWAIATVLAPEAEWPLRAVIAGAAFTAWDVYLDPQMSHWNFWRWARPGRYEGIPMSNFSGWFLWATLISALVFVVAGRSAIDSGVLVAVYVLTWLFQFGGHMVFWRWPISGLAGLVAMGAFAIPALWYLAL